MLVRFIGGPYDGLEADRDTIHRCSTIQSFPSAHGALTFALMPPLADWDRVTRGETAKEDLEDLLPYVQVRAGSGIEFHFDAGGRQLSAIIVGPLPDTDLPDEAEAEGLYYKCLRGDSENLALTEPDSFVIHDSKHRRWICYPVSREDAENLNLLDHVADVTRADATLNKHGLSERGTEVRIYFCRDEAELQEKLGAD